MNPSVTNADTPMGARLFRPAEPADAADLARIYNFYIHNTIITFDEQSVTAEHMLARVQETHSMSLPWLVAVHDGAVVGFAYATKWKGRCAYRYSAETTIYLDEACRGQGIGTSLYREVLTQLAAMGFHTAIGGIALPNDASIRLHEKLGYQKVAHFNQTGFKFGSWIDVGYWQIMLTQT